MSEVCDKVVVLIRKKEPRGGGVWWMVNCKGHSRKEALSKIPGRVVAARGNYYYWEGVVGMGFVW